MDKQDETWAEFSSLEYAVCKKRTYYLVTTNTAQLRVANTALTTFRLSPVRHRVGAYPKSGTLASNIRIGWK